MSASLIEQPATDDGSLPTAIEPGDGVVRSIHEILNTCDENLSLADWHRAVWEAELQPVALEYQQRFLALWRGFIEKYRNSNDPDVLMTVLCAVRKYIAETPKTELEDVVFLLEAGHRLDVPIEMEVTVAKMIVRSLTAKPPAQNAPVSPLTVLLWRLVDDYLRDRFLAQRFVGAVALDAALALIMLRSPEAADVYERLQRIQSRWFLEALADDANEVAEEIVARRPLEADGPTVNVLRALSNRLNVPELTPCPPQD